MQSVFPVLVVIAIAYFAGKLLDLDRKTLAQASLYVFTPALVFKSLVHATTPPEDVIALVLLSSATFLSLWAITLVLARLTKIPVSIRNAYLLSAIFPNNGNYGVPIVLFAYGEAGFERGVVCLIVMALFLNSFGVYIASGGDAASTKRALKNILRMPTIYAFVIGLSLYLAKWEPSTQLMKPITLLGDAAIPTELTLLGLQLAKITKMVSSPRLAVSAAFIKLVLSPLIAALLVSMFNDPLGLTGKVLIVMAGAPTAVISNTLAVQFNNSPELVASTTFITTLASMITIRLILLALG